MNSTQPAIQPDAAMEPEFSIYAIGDAGVENEQSKAVLFHLSEMATKDAHPGLVIFMGDNIYPAGFEPSTDAEGHERSKSLLEHQTEALGSFAGQIIFIPGNHDWNEFKAGGLEAVRRQGAFLESLNDPRVRLLPEHGCAGPEVLQLGDQVVMIIMDSQWWIQDWSKEPGMNDGCMIQTREALKSTFHQLVRENSDKQILVAMHHPLYSQGHHGGYFTFRDHVFPLTKIFKWLWVPLPVIGSIYPWYRSFIGHPQDLKHPRYKSLKEAILNDLEYDGELIFLAGHDHNLQYVQSGKNHFLLSGAGAKQNHVADGKSLIYGHKSAGFMRLDFFGDQSAQLSVFEVDPFKNRSTLVFRQMIVDP